MTNSNTTKFVSAVMAVCVSSVSLAEVTEAKAIDFTYSAAELESTDGTANVEKRIREIANANCRSTNPLVNYKAKRECRADIEAQLRTQIWGEQAR